MSQSVRMYRDIIRVITVYLSFANYHDASMVISPRKTISDIFNPSLDQDTNYPWYRTTSHSKLVNMVYENVEFGITGPESIQVLRKPSNDVQSGFIEFRIDTMNGPPFAVAQLPPDTTNLTIPITMVFDGTKTLYLSVSTNVYQDLQFSFTQSGPRSDVSYVIMSLMHGKVLTTDHRRAGNGVKIRVRTFRNETDQSFQFVPLQSEPLFYKILVKDTGRALTVPDGLTGIEPLVIADYKGVRPQQWSVMKNHNDNYVISARHSGKCLEVQNGDESENVLIIQNICKDHKDSNQEWMIMNPIC